MLDNAESMGSKLLNVGFMTSTFSCVHQTSTLMGSIQSLI